MSHSSHPSLFTLASRCALAVVAILVAALFYPSWVTQAEPVEAVEEAPSAVSIHEPDLTAPQTIWCIANPKQFAISARAVGQEIGDRVGARRFDRPQGPPLTLEEWSTSTNPRNIEDFNRACHPAFEAFGPSVPGSSSHDNKELVDLLNLLAGALLGVGGTAYGERRQAHRGDANSLREQSSSLVQSVAHLVTTEDEAQEAIARNDALHLQASLRRWEKLCPEAVSQADERLRGLLQETSAPSLASPSEDLNSSTAEISEQVDKLARRVQSFLQKPR